MTILMTIKFGIIFFATLTAAMFTILALRAKKKRLYYSGLYWAKAAIGYYWAFYYIQNVAGLGWLTGHEVFVRGGIMMSLAIMAGCAIVSLQRKSL